MKKPNAQPASADANFQEHDWNFDLVPGDELMACCYWEYARESAFICGLRQRCWEHWKPRLKRRKWWNEPEDRKTHQDIQKVQSIGAVAYIFLHGFCCPPDGVLPDALPLKPGEVYRLTGSFPKPWQLLTAQERKYRSHVPPRGLVDFVQLVPFERGISLDAGDIVKKIAQQRRLCAHESAAARQQHPNLTDEALVRNGIIKYPDTRPSVTYASGAEHTVVQINWGSFTNEEIIQSFRQWVKANRPEDIPAPDGKGRNKARDWRVALERLAIMRLLHEFRLRDLST
jgi:hypothetical protein